MKKRMFLLFSHTLTDEQEKDARAKLGVGEFVYMPDELGRKWKQVPPEGEFDQDLAGLFTGWLKENSSTGDYALVQGEFGLTFALVDFCLNNQIIPLYATTRRVFSQETDKDGNTVNRHVFKHIGFRRYERIS